MLDFQSHGVTFNAVVFLMAAICIWFAGAGLSKYADVISSRTGMGEAFTGLLLLAGATSLPELATTVSAAAMGSAHLAVNNVLGGVAMQTAVLALTDVIAVRGALTFFTPRAVLIVQGIMLVVLLAMVTAAIAAGEAITVGNVGLWSMSIFAVYLVTLYVSHRYERESGWEPVNPPQEREDKDQLRAHLRESYAETATRWIIARFAAFAVVITIAGWIVASTGGALATQTGLGESFVGATLVAISTSLPEVTTTIAAARLGAYSMAVSNIFGSNAMCVAIVLPADIAYREGAVFNTVGPAVQFAAALGICVTCVYIWGLLERKDRSILRMGVDSAIVLTLYIGGVVVLYAMR